MNTTRERPKGVLIQLDRATFQRLAVAARDEVRSVDQQAEYLVRQGLGAKEGEHERAE